MIFPGQIPQIKKKNSEHFFISLFILVKHHSRISNASYRIPSGMRIRSIIRRRLAKKLNDSIVPFQ